MKRITGISLFCLLLLPVSFGFSGEIYKWTDKNGRIIFSDSPPPPGIEGETKKFEEPQSPQSKEKPKAIVPQSKPEAPPPVASGTAMKTSQPEPEKPKLPGASAQRRVEVSREKRPYGSINVIMYMTVW